MFKKYDKTYHLLPSSGKASLCSDEARNLLAGKIVVEEKMDGSNVGIIRHARGITLQKRNGLVGPSEHEQFDYFNRWAFVTNYEKLMSVPLKHIIYGELLYIVHTIFYDSLPDFVLVFDVWDGNQFLNYSERQQFCDMFELSSVPLVSEGSFTKDQLSKIIPSFSRYGSECEGVVLKRYSKNGYRRAKIVRPKFIKSIEEADHWRERPIKYNECI